MVILTEREGGSCSSTNNTVPWHAFQSTTAHKRCIANRAANKPVSIPKPDNGRDNAPASFSLHSHVHTKGRRYLFRRSSVQLYQAEIMPPLHDLARSSQTGFFSLRERKSIPVGKPFSRRTNFSSFQLKLLSLFPFFVLEKNTGRRIPGT